MTKDYIIYEGVRALVVPMSVTENADFIGQIKVCNKDYYLFIKGSDFYAVKVPRK